MGTSHYAHITGHIGDCDHLRFQFQIIGLTQVPGSDTPPPNRKIFDNYLGKITGSVFGISNYVITELPVTGFYFPGINKVILIVTTVRLLEETVEKGAHHHGAVRFVRAQSRRLAQQLPHPPQRTAV